MLDERIFDFNDVEAMGTALVFGDLMWATVPEPWRRKYAASTLHWFTVASGESSAENAFEAHVRTAIDSLARPGDKTEEVLTDRIAHADRVYAAFVAERAGRPKVGPLFSPLEACWLVLVDAGPALLDPMQRQAAIEAGLEHPRSPLCARWYIDHPDRETQYCPGPLRDEAVALIDRYLLARRETESAALDGAGDEVMAEAGHTEPASRARL
ncbi:hypothetical protein DBB29_08685 [Pandoraea cepalis]|uniref:Uncharacterized protein n=1 Tax=Pandoraea cepalis TaxID=2508294 RepID=A0AAW7MLS8_9BURK|nr:hypothetical protein [Pandoraea cepalis]MDN4573649.1 hypothetical protein [Pandoraea cepalis]MDN4578191.1 hypothetical protein [Pandoraea cepalis]